MPHEHEVGGDRAVYDHEIEDPRARRRHVADWGVGEELFDHMPSPRRRFDQGAQPARRESHPRERRAEAAPRPVRDAERTRQSLAASEAPTGELNPPTVTTDGRRTVVIRGQGGLPATPRRERPPRTAGERLGHRPDRIAAWAVALGLLLIIIAFATAGV